jgi:hypothetical protein
MVPVISTLSATIFQREPPLMVDTLTKAEAGEVSGNERGRARFLFAQFWMFVDVAPPYDQLVFDRGRTLPDFLLQVRNGRLRLRRVHPCRR